MKSLEQANSERQKVEQRFLGPGGGRMGSYCLMLSLWGDKNFEKCGDGYTTCD